MADRPLRLADDGGLSCDVLAFAAEQGVRWGTLAIHGLVSVAG
jgi:hypothetical protein